MAAVVVGAVLAAGVALTRSFQPASSGPSASARPVVHFAGKQGCKELRDAYITEHNRGNHCERDDDCAVEMRGGQWFELDGCFRFRNKAASPAQADRFAQAWLASACMTELDICEEEPLVMCRRGACAERPPAPLPEDWERHEYHHLFSIFLPPGLKLIYPPHEDIGVYAVFGDGEVAGHIHYEQYGLADCKPANGEPIKIRGRGAILCRIKRDFETEIAVVFTDVPDCNSTWCPGLIKNQVYAYLTCRQPAACERMLPALESIQLY